jgi:hypothetical protein
MSWVTTESAASAALRAGVATLAFLAGTALAIDETVPPSPPFDRMLPRQIRYWAPDFTDLRTLGSYPSVTRRHGEYEIWNTAHIWTGPDGLEMEVDRFTRQRGKSLADLPAPTVVAVIADLLDDTFELRDPTRLAAKRSFSRPYVTYDDEVGYVGLVCSYPNFGDYLHPALLVSKTGDPGSWRYLGQLSGEPADEARRRRVWSDGGSIFRLGDGHWRIYLNGYGSDPGAVSILEADRLEGPWTFLRDRDGAIRLITPNMGDGWGEHFGLFPNILRVSDKEWHLWLSNHWIPTQIWHFYSENGLDFRPYGKQPEIERDPQQPGIKDIRAFLSPDGTRIVGLLSIWDQQSMRPAMWRLYASSMPAGPPPDRPQGN